MKLSRGPKRAVIIFVYLILFSLLGWGIYKIFKPAPSCFDGKKNQNELGVDCGGVCQECAREIKVQDLVIEEKDFVRGSEGKYDLIARITNPNINFGSADFSYKFTLLDGSGNVIASKEGHSYILPKETKYVIDTEVPIFSIPAKVTFEAKGENWDTFSGYEEPRILVRDIKFNSQSEYGTGSDAYGLVINESPYDFNSVRVNVVLRDGLGEIVALGVTQINTIRSNEKRDFRITWPDVLEVGESEVKVEMEPEANVFKSENFIKNFLQREMPAGSQPRGR